MARRAAPLVETVAATLEPIVARICARIADHVAATVHDRVDAEPANRGRRRRGGRRTLAKPVLTRWVADRRARRVPTFVIELTGLNTKKAIVAKYGANAAFEKGKPLPPLGTKAPGAPRAKPPIIRKKAAAA